MTTPFQDQPDLPDWLPESARLYLRHTEEGLSIRALARSEGCHASTVLRKIRAYENRRDDPLVDEALTGIGKRRPDAPAPDLSPEPTETETRRDTSPMSVQTRIKPAHTVDEATVEREARRVLRRLCEADAVLAVAPEMAKAVVLKGTVRIAVVDRIVAQAFALKDWIAVRTGGRVTTYDITSAGRAALKRLIVEQEPAEGRGFAEAQTAFGDQHRVWAERDVMEAGATAPRRMRYNLAESPLAVLARRRGKTGEAFITQDLVAAGERLREDFELAQLGPRTTQNWDRFLTAGDKGAPVSDNGRSEGPGRARDRVAAALRDLGPGLGDMVLRCCCFLEGLEAAEKRMGWSARSGKIVLRIALIRLKRHYDETYGGKSPLIG